MNNEQYIIDVIMILLLLRLKFTEFDIIFR